VFEVNACWWSFVNPCFYFALNSFFSISISQATPSLLFFKLTVIIFQYVRQCIWKRSGNGKQVRQMPSFYSCSLPIMRLPDRALAALPQVYRRGPPQCRCVSELLVHASRSSAANCARWCVEFVVALVWFWWSVCEWWLCRSCSY
jgi:hypothetical protein